MTVPERVLARILERAEPQPNGCITWPGAKTKGYGQIAWHEAGQPRRALVHRAIYEAVHGPLPESVQVDHACHDPRECAAVTTERCEHRACCNPEHLRAATNRENVLRGGGLAARNAAKASCPSGHPYDDANTYVAPNGWRQCKACRHAHLCALRQRRQIAAHSREKKS